MAAAIDTASVDQEGEVLFSTKLSASVCPFARAAAIWRGRQHMSMAADNVKEFFSLPFIMRDGVQLYFHSVGRGSPVVFVHESAADHRQWAGQIAALSDRYRCITYNARGYPPSDVPREDDAYGYEHAWHDLAHIVEHVAGRPAHIVGLSMGAYAGLMLGLHRPDLVTSLILAGCGTGSTREPSSALHVAMAALADVFEKQGSEAGAREIAKPANRRGFQGRDPAGWRAWFDDLLTHSPEGMALTFRNYQGNRPSLYVFEPALREMTVPTLLAVGDEDEGCHAVSAFLLDTLPNAQMQIFDRCGHAINLEAPTLFNRAVADFIAQNDPQVKSR